MNYHKREAPEFLLFMFGFLHVGYSVLFKSHLCYLKPLEQHNTYLSYCLCIAHAVLLYGILLNFNIFWCVQ